MLEHSENRVVSDPFVYFELPGTSIFQLAIADTLVQCYVMVSVINATLSPSCCIFNTSAGEDSTTATCLGEKKNRMFNNYSDLAMTNIKKEECDDNGGRGLTAMVTRNLIPT